MMFCEENKLSDSDFWHDIFITSFSYKVCLQSDTNKAVKSQKKYAPYDAGYRKKIDAFIKAAL